VVALLMSLAAGRCLAGEGFLNRDAKINEAMPYGRTIDETPVPVGGAAPTPEEASDAGAAGKAPAPTGDQRDNPAPADAGAPP